MRFKKLNIPWNPSDISIGKINRQYGSLKYHDCTIKGSLLELAEKLKADKIFVATALAGANVGPHRDHHINSAINFYSVSAAAVTMFWEPMVGVEGLAALDIGLEGATKVDEGTKNVFNPEQIEFREMFIAKDLEVYLLNVSEVHSVYTPMRRKSRTFLQFAWYKKFDKILKMLEEFSLV